MTATIYNVAYDVAIVRHHVTLFHPPYSPRRKDYYDSI